ncbi:hypothetical protein [Reyranella sp.]|uniref:hypothetical protein n=1 Tax=Reyranella sp. TaxID=1929291 RepID=UPI003C7A4245
MKDSLVGKANRVLVTKILAGIGGLLAALLSFTLSIYQGRAESEVPKVAPGKVVDAGRWNVTVSGASLAREMPDGSHVSPGKRALVVDLTLENRSGESSNLYGDVLKIENVPDLSKPQFYLMRDRELLWDVQPMMPEQVKAVWQLPQEQALPPQVRLAVIGAMFKPRDNLYAAPGWFPTKPVATVDLPLASYGEAGR